LTYLQLRVCNVHQNNTPLLGTLETQINFFDLPCHSWRGLGVHSAESGFSQEPSPHYYFSDKFIIFLAKAGKLLVPSHRHKWRRNSLKKEMRIFAFSLWSFLAGYL